MAVVFADTGYFIASLDERDGLHTRAEMVTRQLAPLEIVTTQMVLVEVLNYYSDAGGHHRTLAAQMILDLARKPDVEIIRRQILSSGPRWDDMPLVATRRGVSQTAQASLSWRSGI